MRAFLSVCCGLALALSACAGNAEAAALKAGAAAVDITPPAEMLPIAVNGGFNARYIDVINDPLHAKAICLSDGKTTIVLSTVDSCVLDQELIDASKKIAAKETGIPASQMLVSATHAHSCPSAVGAHGTDAVPEYREFLTKKLAEAIVQSHARLVPAELGTAVGECKDWVHVRRWLMKPGTATTVPFTGASENSAQMNPGHNNPNKIRPTAEPDTSVTLLAIRTTDHKPIAVYGNYSTHYAGAPNISADYFGVFGNEMRRLTGGGDDFVGIMSNGTSGDANCIDFSLDTRRKFTHEVVGKDVAAAAFKAYQTIEFSSDIDLAAAEETMTLDVRMPNEAEVKQAKEFLEKEVKDRLPQGMTEVYAREVVLLSEMPPTRDLKIQAYRIGDLGIATIPCETYSITGLTLKETSPFKPTLVVSLANGWAGYLPPPDQHLLGGYTTWRCRASCLEVEAEPQIREVASRLLEEVHQDKTASK